MGTPRLIAATEFGSEECAGRLEGRLVPGFGRQSVRIEEVRLLGCNRDRNNARHIGRAELRRGVRMKPAFVMVRGRRFRIAGGLTVVPRNRIAMLIGVAFMMMIVREVHAVKT